MSDIADEIEQQVLPELAAAIVAAEVRGDYGPHHDVQTKLKDIARRLRTEQSALSTEASKRE